MEHSPTIVAWFMCGDSGGHSSATTYSEPQLPLTSVSAPSRPYPGGTFYITRRFIHGNYNTFLLGHIYTDASVLFALHARRHASARLLALFTPRLGHGPDTIGLVPWSKAGLQRARNGRQHPQPVLLKVRLSSLP